MGDKYLLINKTIRLMEWMELPDLIDYINANQGCEIMILDPATLDDMEEFDKWLRQLLRWASVTEG